MQAPTPVPGAPPRLPTAGTAPARGPWLFLSALALGVAVVVGTIITARTITYVKTFNTSLITVTGSAVQSLTSDQVEWTGQLSVNTYQSKLKQGYVTVASDQTAVTQYLTTHGVAESDITWSPVNQNQNYVDCKQFAKACGPFGPTAYTLSQTVTVQSSQVQAVTKLAQDLSPIINQGISFSTQGLQYYYTKLDQWRGKLEAAATANAEARAKEIVAATGGHLGRLVSVTTQPLQLTPPNSPQVANGGTYDTTTIPKQLTAIVQASFRLT